MPPKPLPSHAARGGADYRASTPARSSIDAVCPRASRCRPVLYPAVSSPPVSPSTDKGNVRPFGLPRPLVHEFILSKYPPPCSVDRLLDRDRDLRSDLADEPGH